MFPTITAPIQIFTARNGVASLVVNGRVTYRFQVMGWALASQPLKVDWSKITGDLARKLDLALGL